MKIGLIGINRYAKYLNFACDLHVYAFQQFLSQHGHESTIIDYKPIYFDNFPMRNPAPYAEARYRSAIAMPAATEEQEKARTQAATKWAELAMGYRSAQVERARRYDKFEAFVEQNLVFTEEKYYSDLLEVQDPGLDCYICVTDVIWQPIPDWGFDPGFVLASKAFEGKKKIAYAASRGATGDFEPEDEKAFFGYLEDFDHISVRERDFQDYIESRSEFKAPTVLDPTLLHGKEFWSKVAVAPRLEKYLLLYYVMERSTDTIAKAVEYAKLHDLTIVELSDRPLRHGKITDPDVKHIARYDVGMEEWLGYIANAECVFTNSFHGCCFSLIFETPMFVGSRHGQKVPNFLATFGLSDQQFGPDDDVRDFSLDIDWASASQRLEEEAKRSADFILGALASVDAQPAKDTAAHDRRRRAIEYPIRFHSGPAREGVSAVDATGEPAPAATRTKSGALEYQYAGRLYRNDGAALVPATHFEAPEREFVGWKLRFRIDRRWFWYLKDGSIALGKEASPEPGDKPKIFAPGDPLPHLPVNRIDLVVLIAQWRTGPALVRGAKRALDSIVRKVSG